MKPSITNTLRGKAHPVELSPLNDKRIKARILQQARSNSGGFLGVNDLHIAVGLFGDDGDRAYITDHVRYLKLEMLRSGNYPWIEARAAWSNALAPLSPIVDALRLTFKAILQVLRNKKV